MVKVVATISALNGLKYFISLSAKIATVRKDLYFLYTDIGLSHLRLTSSHRADMWADIYVQEKRAYST